MRVFKSIVVTSILHSVKALPVSSRRTKFLVKRTPFNALHHVVSVTTSFAAGRERITISAFVKTKATPCLSRILSALEPNSSRCFSPISCWRFINAEIFIRLNISTSNPVTGAVHSYALLSKTALIFLLFFPCRPCKDEVPREYG